MAQLYEEAVLRLRNLFRLRGEGTGEQLILRTTTVLLVGKGMP
jgi:hypothetical protein